jgi:transcriptional repressor NrdR
MKCPYCNSDSNVTNSRLQKRSNSVWRRRKCSECSAIWSTSERLQASGTYKVQSNEHLVDFRPEILLISLYESLKHRKTPELDAKYVSETVVENLQNLKQATIPKSEIANQSYIVLKNYDKLASDIYKTVHNIQR